MAIIKKFRITSFKNVNSIVEFENVSLAYGNRLILDNISFKINEGQIFGMLGPNGVGKSTIFNLITGLINPNKGKIKIAGEDVTKLPIYLRTKKFRVGYVPQYGGYFNDLSLQDNLKAFNNLNTTVLGISVDSPWANGGFSKQYSLGFDLLSDLDRSVIKEYDVTFEGLGGIEGYTCANRAVYIVKDGTIKYSWEASPNPGVEPNYDEIKSALENL